MGTKVAIIYGIEDQTIHRIIVPDDDGAITQSLAGPGEGMRMMIKAVYLSRSHQEIAASLGLIG
jgi:hypothetical protein